MQTIIIILSIIICLVFILHLLMGKEMRIEKSIDINKPLKDVFDYLLITKNQDNFSTWNMTDPTMKKEYHGIDGQVGFIYKWDSLNKNVGAGEQEIIKIEDGSRIEYVVRFIRPMQNIANVQFNLSSAGPERTNVAWSFSGPTKFPMSVLKPVFQKMLGKDMDQGLKKLKIILEK